jgi:excisionase family DNA binding protein
MRVIQGVKFFSITEIAEKLGINKNTVAKKIREKELKGRRIGKAYWVSETALYEYLGIPKQES